jgi:DNA polymerase-3 subunit gamma/tau
MAYTVLARRYRSTTFDDVIGQDHVAQTLKKAIDSGRVAHAYLFCGTRGVGKTSMARILAKALNCEAQAEPTSSPCGKCNSCTAIARGEDLDVIEIDAASNRGIDNIRDLISNAQYRPAHSRFKIYIIDEVHGLSKDAFNALLKVLEEPPSHVKFILATTEPEKVLPTILSRCQRYDFRNIGSREIAGHLKDICKQEKIKADDDALMLLAKAGAGSMRDALSLLDRMLSVGEKHLDIELVERLLGLPKSQRMFDLAGAIGSSDVKSTLKQATALIDSGLSVDAMLAALVDHLRNLLIIRTCGKDSELVEAPGLTIDDLSAQADRFDSIALTQDITILEELRRQIRQSQAGRALLDATLVRMALSDQFSSIGELLGRLDEDDPAGAQKKNDSPAARAVAPPSTASRADENRQEPVGTLRPVPGAITISAAVDSESKSTGTEQAITSPEPSNIEPADSSNLPKVWQAALAALAAHGSALQSLLHAGTLARIEDGRAVVQFGHEHESSAKMLDRNGKKDLLRDGLSKILGQPVGIAFEVLPEVTDASVPEMEPSQPRQGDLRTPPPRIDRQVEAVAAAAPRTTPVTPEMVDEIRQNDPLIAALMQTMGAVILKVE